MAPVEPVPPAPDGPAADRAPARSQRRRFVAAFGLGLVGLLAAGSLTYRLSLRDRSTLELLEAVSTGTTAERQVARARLVDLGETAAPALVRVVRLGKTRWRAEILPWLESIPVVSRMRTRQLKLERSAIDVLQRMGAHAVPALLPLLAENRHGGRDTAIALLRVSGPSACPPLVDALHHPDPRLRAGAAFALGKFPASDLGSLRPLAEATSDRDPQVRSAALWAIGQMLDRGSEVVPVLVAGLADPDPAVRLQAVHLVRGFAAQAAAAVGPLRRLLREDTTELRGEAILTLGLLGVPAHATRSDLLEALRQPGPASAREAAVSLIQLDLDTAEAFGRLREFLAHERLPVRVRTLELVGTLGPKAEPLVPAILPLLDNPEPRDDRPALGALRAIRPSAVPERFRRYRPAAP